MWTADLSECWLNAPDVPADDDEDDAGGLRAVAGADASLADFDVVCCDPSPSFQHADVTFQTCATTGNDLISPSASVPLPVLQFYDGEAPLEQQLVTPPALAKTSQPDLKTAAAGSYSDADGGSEGGAVCSTAFTSPLSELYQEQFVLIPVRLSSDNLVSILSHVTDNNELVLDDNVTLQTHLRYCLHHHQNQQPQQQQSSSGDDVSAMRPSTVENNTPRLSEEDVMRMLDDAECIVVGHPDAPQFTRGFFNFAVQHEICSFKSIHAVVK